MPTAQVTPWYPAPCARLYPGYVVPTTATLSEKSAQYVYVRAHVSIVYLYACWHSQKIYECVNTIDGQKKSVAVTIHTECTPVKWYTCTEKPKFFFHFFKPCNFFCKLFVLTLIHLFIAPIILFLNFLPIILKFSVYLIHY